MQRVIADKTEMKTGKLLEPIVLMMSIALLRVMGPANVDAATELFTYTGDVLPSLDGWSILGYQAYESTGAHTEDGVLHFTDSDSYHGAAICYLRGWSASSSLTNIAEFDMKGVSCSSYVGIYFCTSDGAHNMLYTVYPDRIESSPGYWGTGDVFTYDFDTISQYSTYRAVIQDGTARLYVNDKIAFDIPAHPGIYNIKGVEFGAGSSGATGEAYFDEIRAYQVLPDNQGPVTSSVATGLNPAAIGDQIVLTANIDDSSTGRSYIASADYSVDGGVSWRALDTQDEAFDDVSEEVEAYLDISNVAGIYELPVRGTDCVGNTGDPASILQVVYDPTGGFVTGGGWIYSESGAYLLDPSSEGKANFGFVSKYKRGVTTPTGQTEFVFQAGGLNFHSSSYDWLVVTGSNYARFKGWGSVNGDEGYRFMLWAGDGPDTFRIRIWWEEGEAENVIYDNGVDQHINDGSIVIHEK